MYKVFVNQKEVILTTTPPLKARVMPLKETSFPQITRILRTTKIKRLYLFHHDQDKLLSLFKKKLPVTIAAGGVVFNSDNKLLFIFRKKKWDLPKGRVESKESLKKGGKREVKEETGVKKLKVDKLAGITYHIFKRSNRYQLKETHWFYMTTTYQGALIPEAKEDITKAVWKGRRKATKALKKTYPNIAHLFEKTNVIKSISEEE
ncbi:MAG: NUDIX domain-containing protein [Flavobacteriaceae bacterium]|nr:NUDIX domain-containing protein [Flavobacteriaceae bacterium]